MTKSLTEILDGAAFIGLAVSFVHTGYNVSIEFEPGQWSPHAFATTASEAIAKCVQLYAPWDGFCACGKREMDGVCCKLGATHSGRPIATPLLPPPY